MRKGVFTKEDCVKVLREVLEETCPKRVADDPTCSAAVIVQDEINLEVMADRLWWKFRDRGIVD